MPTTPILQTVSQCFTARLRHFREGPQHAGQAMLDLPATSESVPISGPGKDGSATNAKVS